MIVPKYWAEARLQKRVNDRQITVRRFGWSDLSQEDAQALADRRTQEAFGRVAAGEKLPRRDLKMPYGGADGMPIREEIVATHGDTVITRNSYGARCLNTPDVLFADVDVPDLKPSVSCMVYLVLFFISIAVGLVDRSVWVGVAAFAVGVAMSKWLASFLFHRRQRLYGDARNQARNRIVAFAQAHADWHLRLYETPAGFRVLALHRTFDPADPEVRMFFDALATDGIYVQMCLNQRCFRARVSPKPWRIGISQHMRPRPGVWPVKPEQLAVRTQWIEAYEAKARGYAACRFIESLGNSAAATPATREVQALHDELCRADGGLPIA